VNELITLTIRPEVYLPVLTEEEKHQLQKKYYVISQKWIIDKSKSC
jgi:hypothetical protein